MPRPLIFDIMEAAAHDERLTTLDRLVLIYLTKFANGDGSSCTVSNSTLAECVGVESDRSMRRSLARLRDAGYLTRKRRRWDTARTSISIPQDRTPVSTMEVQEGTQDVGLSYQDRTHVSDQTDTSVHYEESRPDTSVRQTGHHGPPTGLITGCIQDKYKEQCKTDAVVAPRKPRVHKSDAERNRTVAAETGFDEWYELYPSKKARMEAEKAWVHDLKEEDRQNMIELTEAYINARARAKSRGEFVPTLPLPATYLRGRRWEDEFTSGSGSDDENAKYRAMFPPELQ